MVNLQSLQKTCFIRLLTIFSILIFFYLIFKFSCYIIFFLPYFFMNFKNEDRLSSNNVICCDYFTEDDMINTNQTVQLNQNVVPTLRLKSRACFVEFDTIISVEKLVSSLDDHIFHLSMFEMNHKMKLKKLIVKIYGKTCFHSNTSST